MTTTLTETKGNGTGLSLMSEEALQKLVLGGDLSQLDKQQKVDYYIYRCKAAGLDPATKPFDLLKLSGKEVLYATKECSAQISQRDKLSATVVSDGQIGDIYRVVARCTGPDGRCTDDMGCVTIKGLSGDALCNAMMKATTKAKRRAILTHAGLGMLDESELETIPRTEARVKELPVSGEQPQGTGAETPTAPSGEGNREPFVVPDDGGELQRVTAKILRVSEKAGTKKKNGETYTRYGVLVDWPEVGERWLNTFSNTLGKVAKEKKDTVQSIIYSTCQWNGETKYDLEGFDL